MPPWRYSVGSGACLELKCSTSNVEEKNAPRDVSGGNRVMCGSKAFTTVLGSWLYQRQQPSEILCSHVIMSE